MLRDFLKYCKAAKYMEPPKVNIPHLKPTPRKKPATPKSLYIELIICLGLSYFMFWVINLVFITSKGQEIKPAMQAAIIPPIEALTTLFNPWFVSRYLIISKIGN